MVSVEKLSGVNEARIVECDSCGKQINLGVGYQEAYTTCPICKNKIMLNKGNTLVTSVREKEETLPK